MISHSVTEAGRLYWRKTIVVTLWLLTVWIVATFGVVFFARDLSVWSFFGWPVSFYMAAQGTPAICLWIVWYYARFMNRLDEVASTPERTE